MSQSHNDLVYLESPAAVERASRTATLSRMLNRKSKNKSKANGSTSMGEPHLWHWPRPPGHLSPSYNNYHHSLHLKLALANLLANLPPPPLPSPCPGPPALWMGKLCRWKNILFHCCIGGRYSTKSEWVHVWMRLSCLWSVAPQRMLFSMCLLFYFMQHFKLFKCFCGPVTDRKDWCGPSNFTSHRWVNSKLSLLQTVRFVQWTIRTKDEEWYLYDLHSFSVLI